MRNITAYVAALAIVLALAQGAYAQREPNPFRSPAENLMTGQTSSYSQTVVQGSGQHVPSSGTGAVQGRSTNTITSSGTGGPRSVRSHAGTMHGSPAGLSPFANTHHQPYATRYEHEVSRTELHPQPGQTVVNWGTGFIVSGRRGSCHPGCRWVPGHYEWRERRVWVPGRWREEYVPPAYEIRLINGRRVRIMVASERYERYYEHAHYEVIREEVWVPGYWRCLR